MCSAGHKRTVEAGTPTALRSNPVGGAAAAQGTGTQNEGLGPKLTFGKSKLSEVKLLSPLQHSPERSQVTALPLSFFYRRAPAYSP